MWCFNMHTLRNAYINIPLIQVGGLKSPTTTVLLSISPFTSVNICFMYLGIPVLGTEELMLLNCGVGEDSWKSLGQQRDQTNQS